MLGERDEDVELLVRRAPEVDGLVDGQDPEQLPCRMPQRHEQCVLGLPRVGAGPGLHIRDVARGVALGRPVVLARLHDVRPAAPEALVEERLPFGDPAHLAEQLRARDLVPVDRRDAEVVPRAAVEVDDDRSVAERLGDRAGDRREQVVEVALGAHEPRDLEEGAER